ncbi:MAG: hypothetical protein K6C36_06910 [Clostridia bacterium]|nr:hypothetical protein [Clostridia bacterium]
MKYYLALDCGGTKTAAVLYNEDFQRLGVCITGSFRRNTTSDSLITDNMRKLTDKLGLKGLSIDSCGGTFDDRLLEALGNVCRIKRCERLTELDLGLDAAGIFGDGLLALCGTGSNLFARVGDKKLSEGGYGAAVADEGSGYYVGRAGLIAAIRYNERRGDRTVLTRMMQEHLGIPGGDLRSAVFSIYGRTDRSPVSSVADCAPVVVQAADKGDTVAAAILADAGRLLAEQMNYLINKNGLSEDLPVTISGSMWRANPILLNSFSDTLNSGKSRRVIIYPRLEPVLGVLARHMYETEEHFDEFSVERLLERFPEFAYDIDSQKSY